MSPDEAATVVDKIDRKIFSVDQILYDDLLLRACGFDFSTSGQQVVGTCEGCGREFDALRPSARFCSTKCRVKMHRRNANSSTRT